MANPTTRSTPIDTSVAYANITLPPTPSGEVVPYAANFGAFDPETLGRFAASFLQAASPPGMALTNYVHDNQPPSRSVPITTPQPTTDSHSTVPLVTTSQTSTTADPVVAVSAFDMNILSIINDLNKNFNIPVRFVINFVALSSLALVCGVFYVAKLVNLFISKGVKVEDYQTKRDVIYLLACTCFWYFPGIFCIIFSVEPQWALSVKRFVEGYIHP